MSIKPVNEGKLLTYEGVAGDMLGSRHCGEGNVCNRVMRDAEHG